MLHYIGRHKNMINERYTEATQGEEITILDLSYVINFNVNVPVGPNDRI